MSSSSKLIILTLFMAFLLNSCGGISMISRGSSKDYYSKDFLEQVAHVKEDFKFGRTDIAMSKLKGMNDQLLLPAEAALKRNLMGVIFFGKEDFEQAVYNFNLALSTSRLDPALNSQIQLNLASTYYKMALLDKAMSVLLLCDFKQLNEEEGMKFHKLKHKVAKEMGQERVAMESLVWLLKSKSNLTELKSESYFESLQSEFYKLSNTERLRFIEKFDDEDIFLIGYLAYLEAEKLYYQGEKGNAKDLLNWMRDKFDKYQELEILADNFMARIENFAKMSHYNIGIILPLSGEKASFGKRAMLGIDNAFRTFFKSLGVKEPYQIFIEDSAGSAAVGAHRVKELVEKHQVSAIVGGLFSDEAQKEYLEARKNGVFFVSLSQIFLPKNRKDHLLVEVPGSIESLVSKLFDEKMLNHFGKRAAIIYPESERGQSYVDEFWRLSKENGVSVSGAYSFDKESTDHRKTVQKLLGLKFKRERQEEFDLFNEIYSLEKSTSIRRIQVLKPQVDFDWVFIPSFPREALQIVPSFSYYDAFNISVIGDPSWRSKALSEESYKLGQLSFIGDDIATIPEQFNQSFMDVYGKRPLLVEIRAHDSLKIVYSLLKGGNFGSRDELDGVIRSRAVLEGISGSWHLKDGVWMKNLVPLQMRRGKVEPLVLQNKSLNDSQNLEVKNDAQMQETGEAKK